MYNPEAYAAEIRLSAAPLDMLLLGGLGRPHTSPGAAWTSFLSNVNIDPRPDS